MTRALLLAFAIAIVAPFATASTTGTIGVQLIIFSRCEINSQPQRALPQIDCGRRTNAQPRVTESVLKKDTMRKETAKLITVEW
ncbi:MULTISPECIES: Csu type fimbrial protein [Pantoea]|jgi:hypothetical protein|uniref:hypothetical protein n=1 Tax=Pantoea TaxID=53335 RepID=UPI000EA2DFBE|nr:MULTISPECIES: hypothetical protein [Pantoea]MBZ6388082.1 hypothetical protein [Pantoea piersonii]MBZ6398466.1 hypothetical protein [Pantoea piersonii]MBZ6407232.1 hypothetical protein [Pantoea piersonii]MBZ6428008.1 hypothetical protein [Pantoea piersonii]NYB03688.1 hypothetical protein [Pantoea piersonii]